MTGTPTAAVFASILAGQLSPDDARRAGELTRLLDSLAEQALVLAGGGALVGLGLGILTAGVGAYLYKRRQISAKLQT